MNLLSNYVRRLDSSIVQRSNVSFLAVLQYYRFSNETLARFETLRSLGGGGT